MEKDKNPGEEIFTPSQRRATPPFNVSTWGKREILLCTTAELTSSFWCFNLVDSARKEISEPLAAGKKPSDSTRPPSLLAWIGPCWQRSICSIRPTSYEFPISWDLRRHVLLVLSFESCPASRSWGCYLCISTMAATRKCFFGSLFAFQPLAVRLDITAVSFSSTSYGLSI